jgi:hypothetical protein
MCHILKYKARLALDSLLLSLAFDTTNIKKFFDIIKLFEYIFAMIFKVGDVYRNKETNIPCFIKNMKNEYYVVTWCLKVNRGVNEWGRPLQEWEDVYEGPDGYMEYSVMKSHKDLLTEINYLSAVEFKDNNKIIMNYIPQHSFLAIQ